MKESDFDLVIEPGKVEKLYWTDLWRYRELFYFLAWRDVLVRYKQTIIGIAWCVLRPFLTTLAFVLVFSKVAKLESGSTPYPILVYAALLPWQLFSSALSESSNSLIANANLVSKVYFPRMVVPVSSIIVCAVDFFISSTVLILIMFYYSYIPTYKLIFTPLFFFLVLMISIGAGLWLSALNVRFRDFRYLVPFIIQFGLFVSPVGFSSSIIPEEWRFLYSLNPMVGIIDGFRWCFLRDDIALYMPGIYSSIIFSIILIFGGTQYFRKTEKAFADTI